MARARGAHGSGHVPRRRGGAALSGGNAGFSAGTHRLFWPLTGRRHRRLARHATSAARADCRIRVYIGAGLRRRNLSPGCRFGCSRACAIRRGNTCGQSRLRYWWFTAVTMKSFPSAMPRSCMNLRIHRRNCLKSAAGTTTVSWSAARNTRVASTTFCAASGFERDYSGGTKQLEHVRSVISGVALDPGRLAASIVGAQQAPQKISCPQVNPGLSAFAWPGDVEGRVTRGEASRRVSGARSYVVSDPQTQTGFPEFFSERAGQRGCRRAIRRR